MVEDARDEILHRGCTTHKEEFDQKFTTSLSKECWTCFEMMSLKRH